MQISHYLHTAVLVTDLSRAEMFYGQVLGLPKVERSLRFPGAWYQLGHVQIHLIQAERVHPDHVDPQRWGRNPHLALGVKDLEAARAQLAAHDCPIQLSASGRAALFTQDPDGNVIELSQIEG
jgi:catechol 2,3-dioxygenase-like lactoylglutathione lyase family enzyme